MPEELYSGGTLFQGKTILGEVYSGGKLFWGHFTPGENHVGGTLIRGNFIPGGKACVSPFVAFKIIRPCLSPVNQFFCKRFLRQSTCDFFQRQ